jgi:hypothetical protein
MWTAIKWGIGIAIGLAIAYVLFWLLMVGGLAALLVFVS